jgi:hypothetical protein
MVQKRRRYYGSLTSTTRVLLRGGCDSDEFFLATRAKATMIRWEAGNRCSAFARDSVRPHHADKNYNHSYSDRQLHPRCLAPAATVVPRCVAASVCVAKLLVIVMVEHESLRTK